MLNDCQNQTTQTPDCSEASENDGSIDSDKPIDNDEPIDNEELIDKALNIDENSNQHNTKDCIEQDRDMTVCFVHEIKTKYIENTMNIVDTGDDGGIEIDFCKKKSLVYDKIQEIKQSEDKTDNLEAKTDGLEMEHIEGTDSLNTVPSETKDSAVCIPQSLSKAMVCEQIDVRTAEGPGAPDGESEAVERDKVDQA